MKLGPADRLKARANVDKPGAQADYMKLKHEGEGIPQVVLLGSEGTVLTEWAGFMEQAEVNAELEKFVK